jgi:nicotinamide mononucleotide (NMN) deamidase PncC
MAELVEQELIQRVHTSGKQLMIAVTGGGSRAIPALLEVPGASASVVGAIVPYAPTALESWLGGPVDHFCSEQTARAMAMTAFQLARQFANAEPHVLRGIGATASLATTRPKRGSHRMHVAWQSADTTAVISCELAKGRTRAEEEAVAGQLVLSAIFESCDIDDSLTLELPHGCSIHRCRQQAREKWSELLLGQRASFLISEQPGSGSEEARTATGEVLKPAILFPGAFNPVHAGHLRMAEIASQRIGAPTVFELSITNVDKPPLDFIEIASRLDGLSGRQVLLTRAPTFAEKSLIAPGCVFVVGIDTLSRIADAQYYNDDTTRRDEAIATIAAQRCRFLVFGRNVDGQFRALADLDVPTPLRQLCEEVPESAFRADVSSTLLRNRIAKT